MDYMEAAAQLGQAIANCGEMQEWRKAEEAMLVDEKANTLMEEYREVQMKMVQASREDLGKDELDSIRDVLLEKQKALNEYEVTKEYFETKDAFEKMMKNINEVIQFYVTGEQDCSGSCSSCSGCS